MALLNFAYNGTYTVVNDFIWQKDLRSMAVKLNVFDSAAKNYIVSIFNLDIHAEQASIHMQCKEVISDNSEIVEFSTSPVGEMLIYLKVVEGVVTLVHVNDSTVFLEEAPAEGQVIYIQDTDEFFLYTGGALVEKTDLMSIAQWDTWFSATAMDADGVNIISQIYSYLKTTPQFAGTIDG